MKIFGLRARVSAADLSAPESPRSMESGTIGSILRFGAFELDLSKQGLRKSGVRLKLRRQAFRVLTLLASRAGDLVAREEIQREIWSDDTWNQKTCAGWVTRCSAPLAQLAVLPFSQGQSPDSRWSGGVRRARSPKHTACNRTGVRIRSSMALRDEPGALIRLSLSATFSHTRSGGPQ